VLQSIEFETSINQVPTWAKNKKERCLTWHPMKRLLNDQVPH